ncbi:hypothetical protein BWK58_11360 [Flavobacterium columnare]|nr:hypothetical protein BWK58_11360 [Flavobacterium columnare]
MIYWHIQMNQPWGRNGGKMDSIQMLKEEKPLIGTGNWDDFQCENFKGITNDALKIDDIVLVREGARPLALCQVKSDCFEDATLKNKFHHDYYRYVEVLAFYDDNKAFPQPQGTLQRLYDSKTDSWKFIDKLFKKRMPMQSITKTATLLKYKKQIILQGPPGTGKTRQAKLVATEILGLKDVKELEENDQFKLIQFHPSYTYEDFVRGIVSKPNPEGKGIIYKPENKVLAQFANQAFKNFEDSNKDVGVISKENAIQNVFENFVDYINDEIEKAEGFYKLTENVGLISTDDDEAFRYKGQKEGWLKSGNRILFNDILKSYLAGDLVRQDVKKNAEISGLARQHASYFVRVLNLFQKYVQDEGEGGAINTISTVEKIPLKSYVLVIDEINRANLSSVLGELIYALEYRGEAVESMYDVEGNKLVLPPNLYIIGTMNTADRSVGHIDYAIRRRFAFVNVLPENLKINQGLQNFDEELFKAVEMLFETNLSPEFEKHEVQLGHSYFIDKSKADKEEEKVGMDIRLDYEIKPILLEYVKDGVLVGENIKSKIEDLQPSI